MAGGPQEVAAKAADKLAQQISQLSSPRWTPLPHQVPPPPGFAGWVTLAGRGAGKTDVCANYISQHVKGPPCLPGPVPHWIGIIAPTLGDAATSCFSGPSGIRVHSPDARMVQRPGGLSILWPNGSEAKLFGTNNPEDVERLRSGGNRCLNWLEELAAWRYLDDCWDHMRFGLRTGPHPHWVASTTPKSRPLIKRLERGEIPNTVVTRASTYDNPHLPLEVREALEDAYGGTQLGRQELMGQLIGEDVNALWKMATIDAARVPAAGLPDLSRIVVGVDPSGGAGEQGIVVAGRSKLLLPSSAMPVDPDIDLPVSTRPQHQGYVLDDRTCHLSPDGWGKRAIQAAVDWQAHEVVCEVNFGGDMCVSTLRSAAEALGVSIPVRKVTASRGKVIRAQPVSAMTAQGRWHHAGTFEALEDQMVTWHPELNWSPDRVDACLVAGTLVTTRRGQVPIEAVTTDDQVMTRQGWRCVLRSWMTSPSAEVLRVDTPGGSLTGTANHRVWVLGKGFVRLDAIVWGDSPGAWHPELSQLSPTASPSDRYPLLAPAPVERICALGTRQPVYDLTVEEVPEFFANGILVHNSVWAAWALKLAHTTSAGMGRLGGGEAASRQIGEVNLRSVIL
jgi:phage terminase large subunit-like protein